MNEKRKAPVGVGTPTGATLENESGNGKHTFLNDYITAGSFLSRYLLNGSTNAISTATLLALTGMKSARELQKTIEKERSCGIPILTKPGYHGGYFLPNDDPVIAAQECRAFIHYMKGKGLGCLHSMLPARKLLLQLERYLSGQEELPDFRSDKAEAEGKRWAQENFTGSN